MNSYIRQISDLSNGNAWLVGGFLRDALLGRPTSDVDIAVQGEA